VTEKDEFFSFDEALDRLRLKEEELKRLVSEGEIRAFRDGETMKLRRTDVDTLRRELMGGDVVDLDDSTDEDLVLTDDFADPGMATEELTAADTMVEGTLMTEELDEFDDLEDLDELDELEEDDEDADDAPKRRRIEAPLEPMNPLALAGVFLTSIIMILAFPVLKNVNGGTSDIADSIAGAFVGAPVEEAPATPAADTQTPAADAAPASDPFATEEDAADDSSQE
jgi:excisionase family DNA binding protein